MFRLILGFKALAAVAAFTALSGGLFGSASLAYASTHLAATTPATTPATTLGSPPAAPSAASAAASAASTAVSSAASSPDSINYAAAGNSTAAAVSTIGCKTPTPIDLTSPARQEQRLAGAGAMLVLSGAPLNLTIAQVAAKPASAFSPLSTVNIYPLGPQTALWLHFRVTGQALDPQNAHVFALPKSFVDRVELFYRSPTDGWLMQAAGDHIAQKLWATRGLYPQFQLPMLGPGVHDFYVRVQHLVPLRLDVSLKTEAQAVYENQKQLLMYGLILGFLLFMFLLSLTLSLVYRRSIYALYALYLALAFLSVSAYVGIGHFAFWPQASWWSEQASVVCLMAGLTVQLQFCSTIFIATTTAPWVNRLALAATRVSAAATAGYLLLPLAQIDARNALVLTNFGVTALGIFLIMTKAVLQRSTVAKLFFVANSSATCVLTLTLLEQFGLASLPWLPYAAILYALGCKAAVLLLALHLHVKSGHALEVRQYTLADVDPLTGFVAPVQFPKTLADAWGDARQRRRDLSVVYVQATFKADQLRSAGSRDVEAAALRCVRIIRTVTREADTVARVHANLFAVLMPGVSPGENLSAKLSRLIALGVMTDRDDPLSEPVNLRIAASSRSRFSGTAQQLDVQLRKKLSEKPNAERDAKASPLVYVSG